MMIDGIFSTPAPKYFYQKDIKLVAMMDNN
jgi:hypothetical protein